MESCDGEGCCKRRSQGCGEHDRNKTCTCSRRDAWRLSATHGLTDNVAVTFLLLPLRRLFFIFHYLNPITFSINTSYDLPSFNFFSTLLLPSLFPLLILHFFFFFVHVSSISQAPIFLVLHHVDVLNLWRWLEASVRKTEGGEGRRGAGDLRVHTRIQDSPAPPPTPRHGANTNTHTQVTTGQRVTASLEDSATNT